MKLFVSASIGMFFVSISFLLAHVCLFVGCSSWVVRGLFVSFLGLFVGCSWVVRGLSLGLSLSFGTCRACACACSAASTGGTRFARFGAHPLCTMSECTHTSHACPCRYAHARHTHAQTNNIKTYFYVTILFFWTRTRHECASKSSEDMVCVHKCASTGMPLHTYMYTHNTHIYSYISTPACVQP